MKNILKAILVGLTVLILLTNAAIFFQNAKKVYADETESFNTDYLDKLTSMYMVWASANKSANFDNYANLKIWLSQSLANTTLNYNDIYNAIDNIEYGYNEGTELVFTPDILRVFNILWNQMGATLKNHTYTLKMTVSDLTELEEYTTINHFKLPVYYDNTTLKITRYGDGQVKINDTKSYYIKLDNLSEWNSGTEFPEYISYTLYSGNGAAYAVYYGRTGDFNNFSLYTGGNGTAETKLYLYNLDNTYYPQTIQALTEGTLENKDSSYHADTTVNLNNYDSANKYQVTEDKYFIIVQSSKSIKTKVEDGNVVKVSNSVKRMYYFYNYTNSTVNICTAPTVCNNISLTNQTDQPAKIYDLATRDLYFNNAKIGEAWLTLTTGSTFLPLMTANSNYYQIVQGTITTQYPVFDDFVESQENNMSEQWSVKIYDLYTDKEYGTDDEIVLNNAIYNLMHNPEIETNNTEVDNLVTEENEIHEVFDDFFENVDTFSNSLNNTITDPGLISGFQGISSIWAQLFQRLPILTIALTTVLILFVINVILR